MVDKDSKWFAVVNPHAGNNRMALGWRRSEKALERHGIQVVDSVTDCKLHAIELSFIAAGKGYRNFIAVGGDGTVHEVLGGIVRFVEGSRLSGDVVNLSDFRIAVIPVGSGNDWIKMHGIPKDADAVAGLIASSSFAFQDIVKVCTLGKPGDGRYGHVKVLNCSYMANVAGVGLDARICRRVNMKKDMGRRGRMLYINSLLYNLMNRAPSVMKVECDGVTVFEGRCLSIAFGTGRYSGGGLRQTPDAEPDDGLIDYTIIPEISLPVIIKEARHLFDGTFSKVRELVCGRARKITVMGTDGVTQPVEVDGEVIGETPVSLEVLPDQIYVLHEKNRHIGSTSADI